jgi:hypothetical protein
MPQTSQNQELAQLDGFLSELAKETEAQCELLREHLETARAYLIGAMPAEYRFNLKLAGETLNGVEDKNLRDRLRRFIQSQMEPAREKARKSGS